ncbi:MAG: diaminopimelate decarboxylase [Blautia sp.]|jgi:diaminopimelate decarboxylase
MNCEKNFWGKENPEQLLQKYGSPLYVYNESILKERCLEMKHLVEYDKFILDYSMKANSNPAILKLLRKEGAEVDAMSPGEIYIAMAAGFRAEEIFYICNNVSEEEMMYAIRRGIRSSVDSLAQLDQYGQLAPGSGVAIRVNPGIGAGHHEKVITAGKSTKFGISTDKLEEIRKICRKHRLKVVGINQHIGSLFLESSAYLQSIDELFKFAVHFPDLDFIDLGGGFGVPYHEKAGEKRLPLKELGRELTKQIEAFHQLYGREISFRIEPGRYIAAECGRLLGTVHAVKENHAKYIGTDLGFHALIRPILYDSYHEIEVYRDGALVSEDAGEETVTVVGNICESGDILAKDRALPPICKGDILAVKNAGAYGHVMSSNYNSRLRPAEVLITASGTAKLIRRRDSYEDLVANYIMD